MKSVSESELISAPKSLEKCRLLSWRPRPGSYGSSPPFLGWLRPRVSGRVILAQCGVGALSSHFSQNSTCDFTASCLRSPGPTVGETLVEGLCRDHHTLCPGPGLSERKRNSTPPPTGRGDGWGFLGLQISSPSPAAMCTFPSRGSRSAAARAFAGQVQGCRRISLDSSGWWGHVHRADGCVCVPSCF